MRLFSFEKILLDNLYAGYILNTMQMLTDTLSGFATGLTLIVAIGAQNAFVLRQGLRREYVFSLVLMCAGADTLLIWAGIMGLGVLVQSFPLVLQISRYGGALFLLVYGLCAARRALYPGSMPMAPDGPTPFIRALGTCCAFTFLNPHVYLDTVVLLGTLANQYGPQGRWLFGSGAITASWLWFFALGYGAHFLAPLFARPVAWHVLDSLIACTMVALGIGLLLA